MTTAEAFELAIPAICVWREARGEPLEAQRGVWWVIQNRANDALNRWPKSKAGVVLEKFQFSSFNSNDPNASKIPGVADRAFSQIGAMMDDSTTPDPTSGANAYHSYSNPSEYPAWATSDKFVVTIGNIHFYKL